MTRWSLLLIGLPLSVLLLGFTPFTPVTNVCPACPTAKTDVVAFTSGLKVACTVVAQNSDFYVLERFGEYRHALKTEVAQVEWKDPAGSSTVGTGDQILTKNNVLYHGSIIQEQQGRYFIIQVGGLQHTIWHSQIRNVYKGGTAYTFESAASAPAAPAPAAPPATVEPASGN